MPTFIKTGFWEKARKGYKEWLNLDQFIESKIPVPTYKVYTALLTQTGTDAPVAIVLENTLGEDPIWKRESVGNFYVDSISNLFTTNKTFTIVTNRELTTLQFISVQSETQIYLEQIDRVTSAYVDNMSEIPIEIRVYN